MKRDNSTMKITVTHVDFQVSSTAGQLIFFASILTSRRNNVSRCHAFSPASSFLDFVDFFSRAGLSSGTAVAACFTASSAACSWAVTFSRGSSPSSRSLARSRRAARLMESFFFFTIQSVQRFQCLSADLKPVYSRILSTTPAPTVRPPSRIAKRSPSSIAIGVINSTSIFTSSPGMTISTSAGSTTVPVTSVVLK